MNCENCIYFKRGLFEFPCVRCKITDLDNDFNYYTEPTQLKLYENNNIIKK